MPRYHSQNEFQGEKEQKRKAITTVLGLQAEATDEQINSAAQDCYGELGVPYDPWKSSPLRFAIDNDDITKIHNAFFDKVKDKINSPEYRNLIISWGKLINLYLVFIQNHSNVGVNYKQYGGNFRGGIGSGRTGYNCLVLNYAIDRLHDARTYQTMIYKGTLGEAVAKLYNLLTRYEPLKPDNQPKSKFDNQFKGFQSEQDAGDFIAQLEQLMEAYNGSDVAMKIKIHNVLFPVLLLVLTENRFTAENEKLFGYFAQLPKSDEYWIDLESAKQQKAQTGEMARLIPEPVQSADDQRCCCRLM